MIEENMLTADDYIALRPEIPRNVAKRAIEGSTMTLRLTNEGQTVGMLRILSDGAMFCYIQDVFIKEEWRGCGYGKALIERALFAIERGLDCGYIVVTLIAEPECKKFYEKLGFVSAPNELLGHTMQCIIMKNAVG